MRSGLENKKRQVTLTNEIESVGASSEQIMEQLDVLIEYCDSVMVGALRQNPICNNYITLQIVKNGNYLINNSTLNLYMVIRYIF